MVNCTNPELAPLDEDVACTFTVDDTLEQICDLLPRGRAWSTDPDSTMLKYWRAFAEVVAFCEQRICALSGEFFCDTANETIEQWVSQYGLEFSPEAVDPACLPVGVDPFVDFNGILCATVAARGGNDCDYLQEVALAGGWVIDCSDFIDEVPSSAGCAIAGCTQIGPYSDPAAYPLASNGSRVGVTGILDLWQGRAADHPSPASWERGVLSGNDCIPGSTLGKEAMGPDCCNLTGFYPASDDVSDDETSVNPCAPSPAGGLFSQTVDVNSGTSTGQVCASADNPIEFTGNAFFIRVEVDVVASMQLQEANSARTTIFTLAGCTLAGDVCTPLCQPVLSELEQIVNKVLPAHTGAYLAAA